MCFFFRNHPGREVSEVLGGLVIVTKKKVFAPRQQVIDEEEEQGLDQGSKLGQSVERLPLAVCAIPVSLSAVQTIINRRDWLYPYTNRCSLYNLQR